MSGRAYLRTRHDGSPRSLVLAGLALLLVVLFALLLADPASVDAVGEPESSTIATALLAPGEAGRGIGYGGDVAGDVSGGLGRLQTLEFGWIKLALSWRDAQPSPGGGYDFSQLDAEVAQARASNFQVLVRVHETPGWAGHPSCQGGLAQPSVPELLSDFRSFLQTAAARYAGQVTGYEIWNEPNTDAEWGNCNPNPADFVALMRQAYLGIKAGDPEAIVVSGGLSNTGDGSVPGLCGGVSGPVCGDLIFLQEMYQAGARAGTHWDAIGAHPYGGTCTPQSPAGFGPNADCANGVGLYFRRMDNMRNIINDFGVPRGESPNVPIWPTEMGWVTDFDRGCNIGSKESNKVSLAQQGDYLRGSFEHAADQMPYIGPMFLFLIDHKVGFSTDCDSQAVPPAEFRWFSVFYEGGTPTSAALKLQATPKQPTSIVVGAVSVAAQKGSTIQATVKIINLGGSGERWTASLENAPWGSLSAASGTVLSWHSGETTIEINVPPGGAGTQTYSGTVSVVALGQVSATAPQATAVTVIATDFPPARVRIPALYRGAPAN